MKKEDIYLTTKTAHLIEICRKIQKSDNLKSGLFLKYMLSGISSKQTFVLVAPKKENPGINGCAVLTAIQTLEDNYIWVDFQWVDPKIKDLEQIFIQAIEDLTKGMGMKKIHVRTTKNLKGFKEIYRVVEKLL